MEKEIYNLIILDRSGSMISIRNQAVSGLNETIRTIKKAQERYPEQKQYISILVFCGCSLDYIVKNMPAILVEDIKKKDYRPCCSTPLYDAMGKGITDLTELVRGRTNTAVSVTIITDGYENASVKYYGMKISDLVSECREKGWLFSYIGAKQDEVQVARDLSIGNSLSFESTKEGTSKMFCADSAARQRWYSKISKCEHLSSKTMLELNEDYFNDEE